jgi:hypothetical protein
LDAAEFGFEFLADGRGKSGGIGAREGVLFLGDESLEVGDFL